MDLHQSPESCRAPMCGYFKQRTDQCAHNIPMRSPCAWHRTPEQLQAIEAQEQMTVHRVREPLGRRGL